MKAISSLALVFIFTVSFFNGCKTSTAPPSTTIQDVFPLKVGDRWTYHTQNFRLDGTTSVDTTVAIMIVRQATYQGNSAFVYSIGDTNDNDNRNIVYYDANSNVTMLKDGFPTTMLHYPMNDDESLTLHDTTYPDNTISREILVLRQSNETVSVPAGNFVCLHYDDLRIRGTANALDTTYKAILYFSVGTGLVQERDYAEKNKGEYYMNLFQQLVSSQLN
jgi:hypothetical protein